MESVKPSKQLARLVGALFITGTVAGILSAVVTAGPLATSLELSKVANAEISLVLGALLVLIMGFALAMIPILLYPLFRQYNQALAMGAILFRGALEATLYIAVAVTFLVLVSIGRESAGADASVYQALAEVTLATSTWLTEMVAIVFSIGALIIYYLFYRTKLIPKWLAVWGLIGAGLYLTAPILALFDAAQPALYAPLAVQEMVLAVWLIVKGFDHGLLTS